MAAARSLWEGKPLSFTVRSPKLESESLKFSAISRFSVFGGDGLGWWQPGDVQAGAVAAQNRAEAAHVSGKREVHHVCSLPGNRATGWVRVFYRFLKNKSTDSEYWKVSKWRQKVAEGRHTYSEVFNRPWLRSCCTTSWAWSWWKDSPE